MDVNAIDKLKRMLILYPFILTACILSIIICWQDINQSGEVLSKLYIIISAGIGYYFGSRNKGK